MTAKRFTVVKCIENQWGIIDYSLEDVDQLILIHTNKTAVSIIVNELNRLNEENEQLKQKLHIYHKLASCSNCNYHDYDWFDDGEEFEVCRKGNDVTERICKDWREL